jgi:chorismate synthase
VRRPHLQPSGRHRGRDDERTAGDRPGGSVDLATGEEAATQYQRSDVCAVPAAAVVGEAMVAWVLADALVEKLGGDSVEKMKR